MCVCKCDLLASTSKLFVVCDTKIIFLEPERVRQPQNKFLRRDSWSQFVQIHSGKCSNSLRKMARREHLYFHEHVMASHIALPAEAGMPPEWTKAVMSAANVRKAPICCSAALLVPRESFFTMPNVSWNAWYWIKLIPSQILIRYVHAYIMCLTSTTPVFRWPNRSQ